MRRFSSLAFVAVSFCLSAPGAAPADPAAATPLRGALFVVDPGHGTRFPDGSSLNVGAVGPHGVEEQRVVLAVGEDLARLDNRARAALANRLGATAFIALHADSSLDPAAHGTSVFWLRPNSVPPANAVRARLAPLGLGESQFHARDLAVTNEARLPAVLVELGFVSNPKEERVLATPAFQTREAAASYAALADAFAR
jgi:N-acetylmuramoyl-L-alanine amidase